MPLNKADHSQLMRAFSKTKIEHALFFAFFSRYPVPDPQKRRIRENRLCSCDQVVVEDGEQW